MTTSPSNKVIEALERMVKHPCSYCLAEEEAQQALPLAKQQAEVVEAVRKYAVIEGVYGPVAGMDLLAALDKLKQLEDK